MKKTENFRKLYIIPSEANLVFPFTLTQHAETRMAQRNFNETALSYALEYGIPELKQGLQFYYITQKCLPKGIHPKMKSKLNNMVVVTRHGDILTLYKAKNASKYLRKKSAILIKYSAAA